MNAPSLETTWPSKNWIPLLLEVASTQSPHDPCPWAGVDGLWWPFWLSHWLGRISFWRLITQLSVPIIFTASPCKQLCCLKWGSEQKWGMGRRTCSNWYYPRKTLLWTHGHRGHVYVSRVVWRTAENNSLEKSKKCFYLWTERSENTFYFFDESRSQVSLVPWPQWGSGAGVALPCWRSQLAPQPNPRSGKMCVGPQQSPPETEQGL